MLVRFMNLSMPVKKERKLYLDKFEDILKSGMFIMGKEVEKFENHVAKFCSVKYAVGVSSGTDALILALKALNIKHNDEVIIPDMSFIATANAVNAVGAKVIFCDVNNDFNINTNNIEQLITKRTKAIIPVHYGGKMANMDQILSIAKKFNLQVIEDGSQSFGASINGKLAGSFGDIGCFSLNPMKPLGALGEAGVITTNSKELYIKIKALRYNGLNDNKQCIYRSTNAKIDTIQASFLTLKLDSFHKTIDRRKKFSLYYNKHLKSVVTTPFYKENCQDAFFTYTILVKSKYRNQLKDYLVAHNIEVKVNHLSMHKEPAYFQKNTSTLKNSKKLSKMKLALPCHENLKFKEVKYVVKTIKKFFNEM